MNRVWIRSLIFNRLLEVNATIDAVRGTESAVAIAEGHARLVIEAQDHLVVMAM